MCGIKMIKVNFIIVIACFSVFSGKVLADNQWAKAKDELKQAKEMITNPDNRELVPNLIKIGVNIHKKTEGNLSLLQLAIGTRADINVIKNLIVQGIDINNIDDNGSSALSLAVAAAQLTPEYYDYFLDVIKILIKHGANPDSRSKEQGSTPLLHLCANKNINQFEELISLLLEAGANPNIQDYELKMTALNGAIQRKASLNIINQLLKFGANPNLEGGFPTISAGGSAALHSAILQGCDFSVIEMLLKAKANPNQLNSKGMAPLNFVIAKAKHNDNPDLISIVRILLEYGADPGYIHPYHGSIRKIASEILGKDHPIVILLKEKA